MARHLPDFKPTQVFDWASEPADERPTGFGHSTGFSTGYSLSNFAGLHEPPPSARRRREHRRGLAKLLVSAVLVLGASTTALITMAHYLRAA